MDLGQMIADVISASIIFPLLLVLLYALAIIFFGAIILTIYRVIVRARKINKQIDAVSNAYYSHKLKRRTD